METDINGLTSGGLAKQAGVNLETVRFYERRKMPKVELIYDSDCPNAAPTRENLVRAFAQAGVPANWREWERSDPATPERARRFGSPAILVNGRDLERVKGESAPSCRLYQTAGGSSSGIPSVELIAKALTDGISVSGSTAPKSKSYGTQQRWE